MARIDKTDSAIGIVRAPIAADFASADFDKVIGVGINGTGKVVKGSGQTGVVGVMIPGRTVYRAGQIGDILVKGDVVDVTGLAAGTKYYAAADGTLGTTDTDTYIGFTVEADRLVVAGF